MRKSWKWALALTVLGLPLAAVLSADPAGRADTEKKGRRLIAEEEAVELILLRQKSVQEELKLPADTVQKIRAFTRKQWEAVQEAEKLSGDEQRKKFVHLAEENDRFLATTLSAEQRKRLDQIAMQVAGLLWVGRRHIARELNLTEEQRKKLRQLHAEARKDVEAVLHGESKESIKGKLKELREANRKQLMSLLTDEQKAKWKEMVGPPFKGELRFEPKEGKREKTGT
jgi:Spy/CpxP family protein refolding chaperone